MPTVEQLSAALSAEANLELSEALDRIRHCLRQLSDEQIWSRSRPDMNGVGNLLLHLSGNLRQWIVAGLGGEADVRHRSSEFTEQGPIPRAELQSRLEEAVRTTQETLLRMTPDEWFRTRRIQGFDVSGMHALWHTVPHFRGHTQEIVHQTRELLGPAYQFAWQPATVEQGAP